MHDLVWMTHWVNWDLGEAITPLNKNDEPPYEPLCLHAPLKGYSYLEFHRKGFQLLQ